MWAQKIKNIYNQVLKKYVLTFSHEQTKKKFLVLFDSRIATVGSSISNDIVLLSPKAQSFEGTIVRSKKSLHFVNKHKKEEKLTMRPIEVAEYKVHAIAFTHLIFFIMGFVGFIWVSLSPTESMRSAEQQQYTLPARNVYGNLMDQKTKVSFLAYTFVLDEITPQMFLFTPGNIPAEQLILYINEKSIQVLSESLNRWDREHRVILPKKFLHKGVNEVAFYYKGELSHPWGVRNLYIQPHNPNLEHSNHELYEIAQKLYVERFAKPGNLLRSKKMMEKVLSSYQEKTQAPTQYVLFQTKVKQELVQLQERYLRDARLLIRNEQHQKAKTYYQKLLKELIDPMDPMRIEIHREMLEIGGVW